MSSKEKGLPRRTALWSLDLAFRHFGDLALPANGLGKLVSPIDAERTEVGVLTLIVEISPDQMLADQDGARRWGRKSVFADFADGRASLWRLTLSLEHSGLLAKGLPRRSRTHPVSILLACRRGHTIQASCAGNAIQTSSARSTNMQPKHCCAAPESHSFMVHLPFESIQTPTRLRSLSSLLQLRGARQSRTFNFMVGYG